jgi:hypothetical protein
MSNQRRRKFRVLFRYVIQEAQQNQNRRWIGGLCQGDEAIMAELLTKPELKRKLEGLTVAEIKVAARLCKPILAVTDIQDVFECAVDSWHVGLDLAKKHLEDFENQQNQCGGGAAC